MGHGISSRERQEAYVENSNGEQRDWENVGGEEAELVSLTQECDFE